MRGLATILGFTKERDTTANLVESKVLMIS